jgi:hypothetical protein
LKPKEKRTKMQLLREFDEDARAESVKRKMGSLHFLSEKEFQNSEKNKSGNRKKPEKNNNKADNNPSVF